MYAHVVISIEVFAIGDSSTYKWNLPHVYFLWTLWYVFGAHCHDVSIPTCTQTSWSLNLKIVVVLILLLHNSSYTFEEDLCMLAKWYLCSRWCTSHVGPLASIYGEYLTKVDKYKYMFRLPTFNLLIITTCRANRIVVHFMTTICKYSQIVVERFFT